MPCVQSGTVLVTGEFRKLSERVMPSLTLRSLPSLGASGFVGSWVAQKYLDAGFTVKATVRSSSKGDYLVNLCQSIQIIPRECNVGFPSPNLPLS